MRSRLMGTRRVGCRDAFGDLFSHSSVRSVMSVRSDSFSRATAVQLGQIGQLGQVAFSRATAVQIGHLGQIGQLGQLGQIDFSQYVLTGYLYSPGGHLLSCWIGYVR